MAWGDEGQLECEAADRSEYALELSVSQVTPRYRVPGSAYLPIRPGCEEAVTAAMAVLPDKLQTVLHLCDAADLRSRHRDWFAGLPERGGLVHVGHDSERTYGGYGNLLAALQRLAGWLGDARWFITERCEPRWIDELRIVDGVLRYVRREFADQAFDELAARKDELAADRELREFFAWRIADDLNGPQREGQAEEAALVRARDEALARAEELDPFGHEVLFQRACMSRAAGDHAGALAWFRRVTEVDDPRLAGRLTTMAATAIAAGARETALQWLDRAAAARPDQSTWLLRGYLRGDPADAVRSMQAHGDREALPWTREAGAILEWLTGCGAGEADAPTRARAILGWAELYRIRANHGLRPDESRALANQLYAQAAAVDPLGGEVGYWEVVHRHGHQSQEALRGFERLLASFPEQPSALFWAASGLGKRKEWARATQLLKRYERVVGPARTYESGAARSMLVGYLHMDACERIYERGDHGKGPEALLDEAIALSGSDARWEGPWVAKGDLYEYRGDHATALKLYDAALARNPRSAHALSAKGSCLNNLGRSAEALTCLDRALALNKDYWHAHYAKACTLARSGGDHEAILALIRRALTLEPTRRRQIVEDPDLAGLTIPSEWR